MSDQPTQPLPPSKGASPPDTGGDAPFAEPCRECGAPLGADQRYCLNCGRRRGEQRLPFGAPVPPPAPAPGPLPAVDRGPVILLSGVLALLLALLIGVVLGRGGDDPSDLPAPVVNVSAPAATGTTAAAAAPTAFTSDWPAGTEGWTVQLATLPGTSDKAAVDAAKADATAKGAASVGAVRSDEYPSLPAGQIVVYTGQYPTREAAEAALQGMTSSFPAATVVQVAKAAAPAAGASGSSGGATETKKDPEATTLDEQTLAPPKSAEDAAKKSKRIPDKVQNDNPLPEADDSAPAGDGGDAETIG